ncbi:netrin receptor [Branchiostoma belcheri]|nr:netrin receptor [Branchiostoma belcheri]
MSRRKHQYDFTADHSKGVKSVEVTSIKQQPHIVVGGPSEESFPETDHCYHHLERSDSGVSDVAMTVQSLTETGTPSGGALSTESNHQDQRESGIFDGDMARSDADYNRLSTVSTDSGRPASMEGILDDSLPLHEGTNKPEETWGDKVVDAEAFEEHGDSANNSVQPVTGKEEAELVKRPWRLSKLEQSRPRRYSGSPNQSLPSLQDDKMSSRIGREGRGSLKIPLGDRGSKNQAEPQFSTPLPSDDLTTDGASPEFDADAPIAEESESMNDNQETAHQEIEGEPERSCGSDVEDNGLAVGAEDMTYGQVSKTWEHADTCAIMPVYDARGKFSHVGGRLELRYGRTTVRLEVPADAVPEGDTRELFIRVLPSRGVEPTAVFCGPHGTVFETPVTLSYSADGDGDKAAVQGFLTPTDFGDPTRWHDIADDPDTSFKSEDCMHHFTLKHFTGVTSRVNGASQRTDTEQQGHIVFEANGKMMSILVLRVYIADEDQTEKIKALEASRQPAGQLCDGPRCLPFSADNDNPLNIRLSQPLEHAWNFMGHHQQDYQRYQADQLPCCCQGRPTQQLVYERYCHNNPGYHQNGPEDHLQGAVGGHLTSSNLPVSQCADETGSQERKVKHPVEDACHCEKCQDSEVNNEGQNCHTDDTCSGCHLCTEESTCSSQTSTPPHPGTAPQPPMSQPQQETSHQKGLSTELPDNHLSMVSTNQPVQESSPESNLPAAAAAPHHSEHPGGSQTDSMDQGAAANLPEPSPPQHHPSKLHKLLKKLNLPKRFAPKLADTLGKQKTKAKPAKEQASPGVSKEQAEEEVTRDDPSLPTQEASQATHSSKKDSAYISGVPDEGAEREENIESTEDNLHPTVRDLQRDSGVHVGEGSCLEVPSPEQNKIAQEEGNHGEENPENGNQVDLNMSCDVDPSEQQEVKLRKGADPEKGERESGYTSGVPSMCGDPDVS